MQESTNTNSPLLIEYKPRRKHLPKNRAAVAERRKRLIKLLGEGKTEEEAGLAVGFSPNGVRGQVSKIVNSPQVMSEFQRILEKKLPDDKLADKFVALTESEKIVSATIIHHGGLGEANSMTKDFIEVDDCPTQLKAAETIARMKGHLSDKIADVSFNFSTLTDEQLADIVAGKLPKEE